MKWLGQSHNAREEENRDPRSGGVPAGLAWRVWQTVLVFLAVWKAGPRWRWREQFTHQVILRVSFLPHFFRYWLQPPHFQGSLCSSTWVVLCLSGEQLNYTNLFLIPQGTLKSHRSFSRAFLFQITPFSSTLYIAGQPRSEIYLPSPHHLCDFFLERS